MKKIALKKSLQVLLGKTKQALIKKIAEAMQQHPPTTQEVSWLLLEYTLEYPFPPTLGLALAGEFDSEPYKAEHPLLCYNAADLEFFSENDTIVIDFSTFNELFDTTNDLLEEIPYEKRAPFVVEVYVAVCKALMADASIWSKMKLSKDFHVTARDFELCNEEEFLKELLPKTSLKQLRKRIAIYEQGLKEEFERDEAIQEVLSVMDREAGIYHELVADASQSGLTDIYTLREFYFLRPYHCEIAKHKAPDLTEMEFFTQKPEGAQQYYWYQLKDNVPLSVYFYSQDKVIWHKIFKHGEYCRTSHKYFLKSGKPELEDYKVLSFLPDAPMVYQSYWDGHLDKWTYLKNEKGEIEKAAQKRMMFGEGYKSEAAFDYCFEHKQGTLFKITSLNELGAKTVEYCADDSFMAEAISDYVAYLCQFTIEKLKNEDLDGTETVAFEYDDQMPLYFTVQLIKESELVDLTSAALYENDSPMMSLSLYTSNAYSSAVGGYFNREKSIAFINRTYVELCTTLEKRIKEALELNLEVICRSRLEA